MGLFLVTYDFYCGYEVVLMEKRAEQGTEFLVLLGKKVREQRILKGMTQEEVAEKSGLKANYMTGIENGKRNTSLLTLGKLIHALEIEPGDLFDLKQQMDLKTSQIESHIMLVSKRSAEEIKTINRITKEIIAVMDKPSV
jgi:transcriptional regulator with XRE-family HTH domain